MRRYSDSLRPGEGSGGCQMQRREFITLLGGALSLVLGRVGSSWRFAPLGGAAAWPTLTHAQQSSAIPTIGFLHSGAAEQNARRVAGFRKGLNAAGLVEGKNVAIE